MPKTVYNITLKGYVGGEDFDRATVDKTLADNDGKQVNVLIDSLGGSLTTGLSISAAFKNQSNNNPMSTESTTKTYTESEYRQVL